LLQILSIVFKLRARSDKAFRSAERRVARRKKAAEVPSVQSGRFRPGTGDAAVAEKSFGIAWRQEMNFLGTLGNAFNFIISRPLGYILYWCYYLVRNYGLAIILFTCVTRVLLWPLAVKQQKSQADMMRFQPKVAELQRKYGNNKEKLQEEQMKLYQEEGYNPMGGCLPMLIQLPIIWGLFNVIYKPYTYILGYSTDVITKLVTALKEPLIAIGKAAGNAFGSSSPSVASMVSNQRIEIFLANAIQNNQSLVAGIIPHTSFNLDFSFLGLDLTRTPDFKSVYILFPILCYITQFISTWMSMKLNQMNQQQGATAAVTNKSMLIIMPLMTTFFAFSVPSGITLYWIVTNLFMMLQVVLLNKFYNPEVLMAKAEKESEAKRAKRIAKLKKYEEMTGQKIIHGSSDDEESAETVQPAKNINNNNGKNAKSKQKSQQGGGYQPKKASANGKKTKKQLMEENRRRLSAAREQERRSEDNQDNTEEKQD
jgi:YidC/Oxa1 family membrane protein insertase